MAELKAKIGLETNAFETGLARLQNKVGSFAKGIGGLVVGAFAFDKLLSAMTNAIDKGDQLQDLADKFGISASQLQRMGNAAELSGASLETVAAAMNKAAINASKAATDDKLASSFARIGLSAKQLQSASPQDILMAFADAAQKGTLGADEFRIAQELMGRSATDLLPTLRLGSQEIIRIGQAMGTYTDEQIKALSAASDAIKTIGNAITLIFGKITAAIIPAAAAMAKFLGFKNLAGILSAQPTPQRQSVDTENTQTEQQQKTRDEVFKTLEQIKSIEEKIRQGRMKEPELAKELINKYRELQKLQMEAQNMGTLEDEKRAAEFGLQAAQIRERLAGMGKGESSSFEVLTDSLRKRGGGGSFAQVAGGERSIDYLKRLDDTNRQQLRALITIERNTSNDQGVN